MNYVSDIIHVIFPKLAPGQFANKHGLGPEALSVDNNGNQVLYVDSSKDIKSIESDMPADWQSKALHDGSGHIIYTNTEMVKV